MNYTQAWATVFSKPHFFQTTVFGGSDAALTGYPEAASGEAVKVIAGGGPSGENVLDGDTSGGEGPGFSGIALLGMGSLAGGQWDATIGCVKVKQKFSIAERAAGFSFNPILSIVCGVSGSQGLSNSDVAISVTDDFGAFELAYNVFGGGTVTLGSFSTPIDDAYHEIQLEWQCCVPNGAYNNGDTSGHITLKLDGSVIYDSQNIKLFVSGGFGPFTNAARGIWLGYFGLIGPIAGVSVSDSLCTVTPVFTAPLGSSPTIPRTVCKPSTTVLSTPSRTAGCNQGGVGFTPDYVGPSGVVPVGADPVVGETLTGKSGVHVWAEVTHTIYPAGTVQETLAYAMTDLDDTVRKEGRLLSIGDVECSLSDGQGNLTAGTIDIQISDVDGRPIGTRLVDPTKKYFQRDEIAVFAISTEGRKAGVRPRRIGRALLQADNYGTPVVAEFSGTDPFFCDGGAFGPDKKVPSWTIPKYYVNAPTDVYSKFMPIIYGEVSDEGATDPVTNLPSSRGLCPLTFVGMDGLATGPGGSAEQWGRFNVCLFASYKIISLYGSDIGGGLYGTSGATSDGATPSVIQLEGTPDLSFITPFLANLATQQAILDAIRAAASSPQSDADKAAIAAQEKVITAAQKLVPRLTLFLVSGRTSFDIGAVDNTLKRITLTTQVLSADCTNVDWILGEGDPVRVKIDLATRNGQDTMVFGYPNYVRATNYEDIMGSDGEAYRVTDVWIRGPLLDDHLAGIVTLAANVIGIESVGDGSGLPINDYFTAYNHFLENCVVVNKKGGDTGLWPAADGDLVTYADGTYLIRGSTFVAAQAAAVAGFGAPFKVSAYFADGIATRDALQLWNDNGGCRTGVNEDGQIFVFLLNRNDDTTAWPRIEHVNRVFGEVQRTHPNTEIENVVQGQCDWDPDAGSYRAQLTSFVSADGVLHNKSIRKYSKLIDGKLTNNQAQFNYVLNQRLAAAKDGPIYFTSTGDIGLLDYPIGSGIQFTSIMGPGALGLVDEPLIILTKKFAVDSHLVTLTCLDVGASGSGLIPPVSQQFALTNASTATLSNSDTVAPVLV